ncbi:MAG: alkaline phosphatase family protein [Acidobacteriota bacterium]|nr:MAG: alkaline phosphatase family protein [Acidobacteriota bacterium]
MRLPRDRIGLRPALWLILDAAVVAAVAGPTQALLMFLLSPDRPLTLRDFLATLAALTPQIVPVFVLSGPLLVLLAAGLSVGRFTRSGPSVRYMLRFALLDVSLLAAAALYQWTALSALLPEPGRIALGLMVSSTAITVLVLLVLVVADLRWPESIGAPWLIAIGLALLLTLGVAASLRRVRYPEPRALDLPGFEARRELLLLEIPALDPRDLSRALERGELAALGRLAETAARGITSSESLSDSLSLHATLMTGKPPSQHGLLSSVRYRPLWDRRSFAVMPRGLLLRPLLLTPLWERIPVDYRALRTTALPHLARGLSLPVLLAADPLDWPVANARSWFVAQRRLGPGARIEPPHGGPEIVCSDPGDLRERYFEPPSPELERTAYLGDLVRRSLSADRCALAIAERGLEDGRFPLIHVRLSGYDRVAYRFAGWRRGSPARGVTTREMAAYGRTMTRYLRDLDQALEPIVERALNERLIVVVAPHGVAARQDPGRVFEQLLGLDRPTGTHAGPPPGVLMLAGEGIEPGRELSAPVSLGSVLPTVLWSLGMPAAEDMGAIVSDAFTPAYRSANPVISVPSYDASIP